MRNVLIDKEYNEKLSNLIDNLSASDNDADQQICNVLRKSILALPTKIGNGPEAEYHCPDCNHDLIDYRRWKDDRFCIVCGKRIRKPKVSQSIDYNFFH